MLTITNENEFAQKINARTVTVVDFSTTWCHSCKNLEPALERLSGTFKGRSDFVKVDGDQNPSLVQQFGVSGYPTLVFFKNGAVINKLVGSYPESMIKEILEGHL